MSTRKFAAALVALVVAGAGLVGSAGTAQATTARPTLAAPSHVMVGHTFSLTAWPHRAGSVVLQRRVSGSWTTVAHHHSSGRKVVFRRTEHSAATVSFRVRVGTRTSTTHRVRVVRPVPTEQLAMSVASDGDIYVGDGYTVGVEAFKGSTPLVGRTVTVQRLDPGKTAWTTVGTLTTGSDGTASLPDSELSAGLVEYRAQSGSLSAFTQFPVFQVVQMPGPGANLIVTGGCGASASGGSGDVTLHLTNNPSAKPPCAIANGNSVQVEWKLPKGFSGGCTPVQFDNFTLTGGSGGAATVAISVPGNPAVQVFSTQLSVNGSSGGFKMTGGDPVDDVLITMTAASSNVDLNLEITGAQAVCF